jgi:hypothetical protein
MAHFPTRKLPERWRISKSSANRVRKDDPDYRELVTEYEVGGVTMVDDEALARFDARKLERGEIAKQRSPVKRKRGRPPKVRVAPLNTAA